MQTLLSARYSSGKSSTSGRNHLANRIYDKIPVKDRRALEELTKIKKHLGENWMDIAHPHLLVSDLHDFLKSINPSFTRSTLPVEELETMEIWREDQKERLFA